MRSRLINGLRRLLGVLGDIAGTGLESPVPPVPARVLVRRRALARRRQRSPRRRAA